MAEPRSSRALRRPSPVPLAGPDASAALLEPSFFSRGALAVARDLIGKCLVREIDGEQSAAMITETEAYVGPHDLACHAAKGCTPRTAVMFGPAGVWYVYFCYGVHWMLNVVTNAHGYPAAVLIRGAGPWNGPAKLTKALSIDRQQNGLRAEPASGLWIEDRGEPIRRSQIERTARIGVDYAGEWMHKPYRFVLKPAVAATRLSRVSASQRKKPKKK